MKKRIIHNVCICLALLLLASCKEQTDTPLQEDGMVTLSISAAMVSRAVDTGDDNRIYSELMHTLRIIIFNEDGNVEHNRLYTFDEGLFESENHNFLVKANQTKTIYLLANCESFAVKEEDNPTISKLDELELNAETGILQDQGTKAEESENKIKVLPATAKYSIQVEDESKTETLYVVHAANKISFEFDNQSGEDITISEWRLASIAQRSYLVPHITGEDDSTPEEDRWYNKVLDQYQQYQAEAGLTSDYPAVMNYEVPADADHDVFTQTCNLTIPAGERAALYSAGNPVYLHESKSKYIPDTPEEDTEEDANTAEETDNGKEQSYTLSCIINGRVYDAELPNLPSLFRSTYIKIVAAIYKLPEAEDPQNPYGVIVKWEDGDEVEGELEAAEDREQTNP